ncbi:uncharacterized protein B0I36DRAFT_434289 [Microdochium trichocladiopsis]|uniref:Uncharacterized protein n=1 Tax=Microdochium trichocladiopsis TaxID=1682393 RepID=A0A9P9BL76_9PEZI|nr:uncharacterized protein B0I36DRAFT_434289 [Microdochium trichocladiopsis]KAH7024609.1 hypothetical protein B0I36DRAFT_434289 [Microdochium trichocladiopsis]
MRQCLREPRDWRIVVILIRQPSTVRRAQPGIKQGYHQPAVRKQSADAGSLCTSELEGTSSQLIRRPVPAILTIITMHLFLQILSKAAAEVPRLVQTTILHCIIARFSACNDYPFDQPEVRSKYQQLQTSHSIRLVA